MILESFGQAFPDYKVEVTDAEISTVRDKILTGDAECAFLMEGPGSVTYYVDNYSMYDRNVEIAAGVLQQVSQVNAMMDYGMTPEQISETMNLQVTSRMESLGKDQVRNFFYTYIMIFALYMVILMYGTKPKMGTILRSVLKR